MSEVKRIFTPGFTELPGCGDRCWSSAIDVDQWGARIEVYGMTSAEATELRDEVLRSITDFDAQRLRADTAEADRDSWKSRCARRVDDIGLIAGRLQAAEQRVSELEDDKARIDWLEEQPVDTLYLDDGRIIDIAGRIELRKAIDNAMRAALNQKSEGERHE